MKAQAWSPRLVSPSRQCCWLLHSPVSILAQDRVGYKILLDTNNLRSTCQHGRPGKWSAIVIQDEYNESQYEAFEYIYAPVRTYMFAPLIVITKTVYKLLILFDPCQNESRAYWFAYASQ